MKNSSKQIDRKILKTLEPLNRLNPILLDELAAKSIIDEVPADRIICRHGDKDSRQIYLLSGKIEVAVAGETKTTVIKSKSALKTPLAEGSPRKVTLKTKTASTLLYIDADLLELLMSDEPELTSAASYEVTEISADDDDWMLTFLQSPAFLKLPTENIQKLLTQMEEVPVKKGQVIIRQGEIDDNYYIIKSGTCNVHRKPIKNAADILLAVLPTGSGFGEEALISNGSRNATITMREDGSLMRLKKQDFLNLLINPLIHYFEHNETQKKLNEGCVVIDVRSEQQSKQQPLEGAVNIPLSMLRVKFDGLSADREYLLVCNDGSQSAAAAFLMIQSGLKCSVLKGGINDSNKNSQTKATATPVATTKNNNAAEQASALAKKQTEQIAAQQKQIKADREKAEQDIIKHKKELAESRARIAKKNQHITPVKTKTTQLKEKAAQELAKAQAESKAIELRQKETNEAMQHAEKIMKESAAKAEQARKQAEKEAAQIRQQAMEEAKQLRAEVEAARQKMEQDSIRLKQEEKIIKESALKVKNEADEIRRNAMDEAQKARTEIEAARVVLEQKLQQTKDEEKRKHAAILAEAKKQADKLNATKTEEAKAEADAIRQKAKEDALRLHDELEDTRKQIEAEATRVIAELKEKSNEAAAVQEIRIIEEEVVVELVAETAPTITAIHEEDVNYKSVSIPGMSAIEPINLIDPAVAKQKAEAIKEKLIQSQANTKDDTHLDDDEDLFIFKAPENMPVVAQRTRAENALTQIATGFESAEPKQPEKSVVIFPQQKQGSAFKSNPFLNQDESHTATSYNVPHFDKEEYARKHYGSKSNTLAIAASFLMILAGTIFTLHATNTVKVQAIAALFNSGNDTVQTIAVAKKTTNIRKKVLRANTKVNVQKKVGNKMDDIMQSWKDVLSEAKNPKKSQNNQ